MVGKNVDRECTITMINYNTNRSDPLQAALRSANVDRITDVGDGIADLSRDGGGPLGLPPLPIRHMDVYPRYATVIPINPFCYQLPYTLIKSPSIQ